MEGAVPLNEPKALTTRAPFAEGVMLHGCILPEAFRAFPFWKSKGELDAPLKAAIPIPQKCEVVEKVCPLHTVGFAQ